MVDRKKGKRMGGCNFYIYIGVDIFWGRVNFFRGWGGLLFSGG